MRKKSRFNGPFDLIRLFGHIKDTEYDEESGILDITIDGLVEITPEILEGMKKSGFIIQRIWNSIGAEYVHIHELLKDLVDVRCEYDVPIFVYTTLTFKDYRVPAIAHSGKGEQQTLAKIKADLTDTGLAPQESVRINQSFQEISK